ncbi:MAG: DUF4157 domain-containing protein [Myxococcota bacterium]
MKIAKDTETRPEGAAEGPANAHRGDALTRQLRTMSFAEGTRALQPKSHAGLQCEGGDRSSSAQSIAQAAFQGPSGALPHRAAIESSYGVDMGAVQAYTGPAATAACEQLGARAFAVGNRVAFADTGPSKHLAAHEAAHVVQQSDGVQLSGGMGRAGDRYEVAADAAADRVVAGQSAQDLLPQGAAVRDIGDAAVQCYTDQMITGTPHRVADDGSIAVNAETIYGSKVAYADASLIASASKLLEAGTSVMSLEAGSYSITVEDEKGTKRTLPDVVVTNTQNNTKDNDMLLYADCGRSARTVSGADKGRGDGSGSLSAEYQGADGGARSAPKHESGAVSKCKIVAEHIPEIRGIIEGMLAQHRGIISEWPSATTDSAKKKIRRRLARKEREMWAVCEAALNKLSDEERDALDKKMAVNRYADPEVGQALHISTGGARHPDLAEGEKTWNFHWAGVVMKSGSDSMTLENYAVGDYEAQNTEWVYQLYGVGKKAGQSFHEQHKDVHKQHGESPTTMAMDKRK